jgi:hypothetical protein
MHEGEINRSYVLKFENSDVRILEGETSSLIQNKTKKQILINEKIVDREGNFSRGIPFIINNQRIFN